MKQKYNFMSAVLLIAIMLFPMAITAEETEEHEEIFRQAEAIIQQKISCDELSLDQLEILGDYYMEQMHSGELHEIMDERMGGEGSASLRQVHINMGLMFYCGQRSAMSSSMMNMMMGRSYGMMNYPIQQNYENKTYSQYFFIVMSLIIIILIVLLVILISRTRRKGRNGKRK